MGGSRHTEVTVLAFVLSHALWKRLLGLAILKGAEVEGPGYGGLPSAAEMVSGVATFQEGFLRASYSFKSPT